MKKHYFTKNEIVLWAGSILFITISFFMGKSHDYVTLTASLIGASSLILNAKGNPLGQVLMIVFSILYGAVSYTFSYFGEMITYLGMTLPMSLIALVSWIKNPYEENHAQVKVNKINKKDVSFMIFSSVLVTILFFFILKFFNTSNLIPSTISVTTSYAAAYLTFKRSPYFALAYALNDIVLIVLWIAASFESAEYVPVVICFTVFLVNDLYGFINWLKMEKQQAK